MSGRRRRHGSIMGFALVGFIVARAAPAAAGPHTDFSQEELRTLPHVCLAHQFINEELDTPVVPESERKRVADQFGPVFIHYHHYCWAVLHVRRAEQPGGDSFSYRVAVDSLNYVILRADPSFALLAEVYFAKGQALERLGEKNGSMIEYRNAVRTKTGHTPAAAALIDSYLEFRDVKAARAALEEALKHDPESETLAEKKAAIAQLEKEQR